MRYPCRQLLLHVLHRQIELHGFRRPRAEDQREGSEQSLHVRLVGRILRRHRRRVPGNTVKTVRYRVIHDGGAGRYKAAKGTTRWTATITVAPGTSTIEFQAVGNNNGGCTDRRHTVVR